MIWISISSIALVQEATVSACGACAILNHVLNRSKRCCLCCECADIIYYVSLSCDVKTEKNEKDKEKNPPAPLERGHQAAGVGKFSFQHSGFLNLPIAFSSL